MIRSPLDAAGRAERVRSNIRRFGYLPRLRPQAAHGRSIAVCGFGPSLADTWREIGRCDAVITTSGALEFLKGKGLKKPEWYHLELDPREHKTWFVRGAREDVTYFIASHCHPEMFQRLAACRVAMWHGFTDEDAIDQLALIENMDPGARVMAGGTNAGMRCLTVARELGFKNFALFGMDCCYKGDKQWAGEHSGARHHSVQIRLEGKVFDTSDVMLQSTSDFFITLGMLSGCRFRVHGDGLLDARLKLFNRDREKALGRGWFEYVRPRVEVGA